MNQRAGFFEVRQFAVGKDENARHIKQKTILSGGWLDVTRGSLRWYEPDQVMRVERGSLLSVPHRGTPRSINCKNKYTLKFQNVNLIIRRCYFASADSRSDKISSADSMP